MELFTASNQWFNRPADERFRSLQDMQQACLKYRQSARTATLQLNDCTVQDDAFGDLALIGPTGASARFSHHSFSQLCTEVGAPANYLRNLPSELAAENLNHGLTKWEGTPRKALMHCNGSMLMRCVTSEQYARIWNHEVLDRLIPLEANGWHTPPSLTDTIQRDTPTGANYSGLYASDHDMFAFLVNDDIRIDDGTSEGLARGFFVSNSEVGKAAMKVTTFLYRFICGNHIVWGASNVHNMRVIHKGKGIDGWNNRMTIELQRYADESASEQEATIKSAKRLEIAATKDEVLDALFGMRNLQLSRKVIDAAYSQAEVDYELTKGAPPNTVWGMVQGLTRQSQKLEFADQRNQIDVAAGKVLEIAF